MLPQRQAPELRFDVAPTNGGPCKNWIFQKAFEKLQNIEKLSKVASHTPWHTSTTYKRNHGGLKAACSDMGVAQIHAINMHTLTSSKRSTEFEIAF